MTLDIDVLIEQAQVDLLDDGTYFTEVHSLQGVWGNGPTAEDAILDLRSGLQDWFGAKGTVGD